MIWCPDFRRLANLACTSSRAWTSLWNLLFPVPLRSGSLIWDSCQIKELSFSISFGESPLHRNGKASEILFLNFPPDSSHRISPSAARSSFNMARSIGMSHWRPLSKNASRPILGKMTILPMGIFSPPACEPVSATNSGASFSVSIRAFTYALACLSGLLFFLILSLTLILNSSGV